METFRPLLSHVWREVCRHLEIQASVDCIAQMLSEQMPLGALLVSRYDPTRQVLQSVACGGQARGEQPRTSRCTLTPEEQARWRNWMSAPRVERLRAGDGELGFLVPSEMEGDALACPLQDGQEGIGVATFGARRGERFTNRHATMAWALREPLLAALENDRRLTELATLREAAEAERRSLLSRMGRQQIQEEIVGAETGLRQVIERVSLVAQSDVPVLILGETGTGKEVVSRAIHVRSARNSGPFIRVNCGAIPTELIDSQLFGHEKGSFTGAHETRRGWFERANGGTLFLDEIGELPLAAQVRLLRVLQDGFMERVGGEQSIRVDVRIIAATHRELAEMVRRGTFREDLWYRVNVFPILLPRLCERLEDIPALARHFAQRAARHFGLAYVEPTPQDLLLLSNYGWPGNIRELAAVIDRAAILGNGKSLQVAQALGVNRPASQSTAHASAREPTLPKSAPLPSASGPMISLDEAMKAHIQRALVATRGQVEGPSGAARLLKINPHTLRARMRKLQIDWTRFRN